MAQKEKKYSFRMKVHEGHTLKLLMEVLTHIIKTSVIFSLHENGIDIPVSDSEDRSFFKGFLDKNKFNSYYIAQPMNINLDLSSTIKKMKHIKKKDILLITRYRDKPDQLEFKVKVDKSKSEHISYISINDTILLKKFIFPDIYGRPISILASDFYKNCKSICSSENIIKIFSKRVNRIELLCEDSEKKTIFDDADSDSEYDEKGVDLYEQSFPASYILKIAKLVNLTPKNDVKIFLRDLNNKVNPELCLCIKLNIGTLGSAEFLLKSDEQLDDRGDETEDD